MSDLMLARSDLFDEDVGLAGVPGDIADHAQVDEPQVHRADQSVFGGVVQSVARGDLPGLRAGGGVLGDDAGQGLGGGDVEAAVAAGLCPSQSSASIAARVRWNQMRSAAAQCLIRDIGV